ncbi:DNA-binding SARP family transcriptional activator [Herbihabitans rhizosphaerae]|uniref:DNA-binding SARP family transcriptional activator n=1 Tax=Herbihabitans rhizosphaerae TaxID=1872711 RepID=A0A4Q7KFL6_9PSEU|nr:bacterial transcriptional activator domain-containing protein [Herbihabitans rhizosphaerae]RZS32672.1 DNA-binding SARP family transcriptional activator [Herbihabitans rhizosphaerae]
MLFHVLGRLEVRTTSGHPVALDDPLLRRLLLVLLHRGDQWTGVEHLADALWNRHPPPEAVDLITEAVRSLRRDLPVRVDGGCRIEDGRGGYRLRAARDEVDKSIFIDLAAIGARAMVRLDPATATTALRAALALWVPDALEGEDIPALTDEFTVLADARYAVRADLVEALHSLGAHTDSVPILSAMVAGRPARQPAWCHLVRALRRAGRPDEAIDAYLRACAALAEAGVEPGVELRTAHLATLTGQPDQSGQVAVGVQ